MNKYLVILLLGFLYSCQPKSVEKNGGLIIDIKLFDKIASDVEVNSTIEVLKNRIDYFCYNNPSVIISSDKSEIQIKLPLIFDTILYKDFIIKKGKFEILETFENQEINKCLVEVNNKLFQNHDYNYKIPNDSFIFNQVNNNYPLFRILYPSTSRDGNLLNGPVIGYSQSKDTALINSILRDRNFTDIFPAYFDFKWAKIKNNNYLSLIAVKRPINYKTISSDMILEATTTKGNSTNYNVNFALKTEYYQVWADLTKNNIGKSLAIIIDNEVFSFPKVTSEIQSGTSTISSNMTLEQAKALSTTLKYGITPLDFVIKKMTIINVP